MTLYKTKETKIRLYDERW